jgi:dipeptidyl aminopeptidase/acylaminoacyl peptidase
MYVHYPSSDGVLVPAILWIPKDIQPGEKRPAVMDIHGGPTGQWFRSFNSLAQLLVDRGYVVLQPNVRGSTGYGVEWRDACIRDWGGKDLEDVAAGARYLASLDFVDGNRIAVLGGSYGGYLTYMAAVKKPELFKAAVALIGITDLNTLYEEGMPHIQYYLRQQMGDPVEDAELWRDRSALNFAHQLQAKLLMMHGLNDPRCPIGQARRFRDRLLELGRREGTGAEDDFEYHEFEMGHGSGGSVEQRIREFELIADFLERRLKSALESEAVS